MTRAVTVAPARPGRRAPRGPKMLSLSHVPHSGPESSSCCPNAAEHRSTPRPPPRAPSRCQQTPPRSAFAAHPPRRPGPRVTDRTPTPGIPNPQTGTLPSVCSRPGPAEGSQPARPARRSLAQEVLPRQQVYHQPSIAQPPQSRTPRPPPRIAGPRPRRRVPRRKGAPPMRRQTKPGRCVQA